MEHFVEVFRVGKADAALAASIFHFGNRNSDAERLFERADIEVRFYEYKFRKDSDGLVSCDCAGCGNKQSFDARFMNAGRLKKPENSESYVFFTLAATLWTKGETSGNYLEVKEILLDSITTDFIKRFREGRFVIRARHLF